MQHLELALAGFASTVPVAVANAHHISVELIAESTAPEPGHSVLIGLQMRPQPGWHGYWSNPGQDGLAPVVKWTAPPGVHFGPLHHPAPSLLKVQGVTSYVHTGPYVLISRMTLSGNVPSGTVLPISADASWAACSDDLCVPERATLSLQMVAGNGELSDQAVTIRRASSAEPKVAGPGAFEVKNGKLVLQLPASAEVNSRALFFPDENGWTDPAEARVLSGLPVRITMPVKGPIPDRVTGVVSDGSAAYRVTFRRHHLSEASAEAAPQPAADVKATSTAPVYGNTRPKLEHSSREPERPRSAWRELAAAVAAIGVAMGAIFLARRRTTSGSS